MSPHCITKWIIVAIITFLLSNVVIWFYYNPGIHYSNPTGATDYIWDKDSIAYTCVEGLSYAKTDGLGYYNKKTIRNPGILLMGSSHLEGTHVGVNNLASQLNNLLNNDKAYNIGISGHAFLRLVKNYSAAVDTFAPTDYVILETNTLILEAKQVDEVLDGTMKSLPSYGSGIIGLLQKSPTLKLLYNNFQNFKKSNKNSNLGKTLIEKDTAFNHEQYSKKVGLLLDKLVVTNKKSNLKSIIVYHPGVIIADNDYSFKTVQEEKIFAQLCEQRGIIFLNMRDRFEYEYKNNHVLPYGFINTTVGKGHLNMAGTTMMAEELHKILRGSKS